MTAPIPVNDFHFGYDVERMEFVLWKRGRRQPVAQIPFANALKLMSTVAHVAGERASDPLRLGRSC